MPGRKSSSVLLEGQQAVTFNELLESLIKTFDPPKNREKKEDVKKRWLGYADLKNNLKSKSVKLSDRAFQSYLRFAGAHLQGSSVKDPVIRKLNESYQQLNAEIVRLFNDQRNLNASHRAAGSGRSPLTALENTSWDCYERQRKQISRKIIHFHNASVRQIEVVMYPSSLKEVQWKGTASFENTQKFLLISLVQQGAVPKTSQLMVWIDKTLDMELCIGHRTFEHARVGNVVTKTGVLHQRPDESPGKALPQVGRVMPISDKSIPDAIRKLLLNRDRNRLSSPHNKSAPFFTLHDLERWHRTNINRLYRDVRTRNSLIGDYQLIHAVIKKKKVFPIIDFLSIKDRNHPELTAEYFHQINSERVENWNGLVQINTESRLLSIYLDGPDNGEDEIKQSQPIFLMVHMPTKDKEWNVLPGVIAGNKDFDEGPIARVLLLVKLTNKSLPQGIDTKMLKSFFNEQRQPLSVGTGCNFHDARSMQEWLKK